MRGNNGREAATAVVIDSNQLRQQRTKRLLYLQGIEVVGMSSVVERAAEFADIHGCDLLIVALGEEISAGTDFRRHIPRRFFARISTRPANCWPACHDLFVVRYSAARDRLRLGSSSVRRARQRGARRERRSGHGRGGARCRSLRGRRSVDECRGGRTASRAGSGRAVGGGPAGRGDAHPGPAHAPRDRDPPARRRGAVEPRGCDASLGDRPDGQVPPGEHLPQARRPEPVRGQPVGPRPWARPGRGGTDDDGARGQVGDAQLEAGRRCRPGDPLSAPHSPSARRWRSR